MRRRFHEPGVTGRRQHRTAQQRRDMALLVSEVGAEAVAEKAQVSLSTVFRWCREFKIDTGRRHQDYEIFALSSEDWPTPESSVLL